MLPAAPATSHTSRTQPIFGPPARVLQSAGTLLRIAQLDATLPNSRKRQSLLEAVEKIWREGQKQLFTSLESAKGTVSDQLKALDPKLGPKIFSIYAPELDNATTIETFQRCALRCIKDTKSVQIPPLQKSHRGVNGPTLLVSYPRPSNDFTDSYLNNYVVKWAHLNERCANHLYDAFSKNFGTDIHSPTFTVPKTNSIDLTRNHHEMHDRSLSTLQPELTLQLRQKFLKVAKTTGPNIEPKDDHILLMERICGENLFDFGKDRYDYLSQDQKEKLFNQLGQVAMLDVLFGNQDRLIQVYFDKDENTYRLETFESNLGNIMISWAGDTRRPSSSCGSKQEDSPDPVIYTIDNGIGLDLIEDPNNKEQYAIFLKKLCTNPKMEQEMAIAMTQSILTAVNTLCDDEDNRTEAIQKFKPFTNDLKKFGAPAFESGIKEMLNRLHSTLLPLWDSKAAQPLKTHLSSIYPDLALAVAERIEVFKSVRN